MNDERITGLVRTRGELLAAGWTDSRIAHAIRRGHLTPAFAGTYVTFGDPATEPRLMLAALQAHLGPEAVGVLSTAARVHGLPTPWPDDQRVHVRIPPGRERAQRRTIAFHAWALDDAETCEIAGLRVTTLTRTLVDLMCSTDRLSAVSALDAALHQSLITEDEVASLARRTRQRRGARRSRGWWSECDRRAESPLETRVRLRANDAGYPPDVLQLPLTVAGRQYRADLAWRQSNGRWLVGEADGVGIHDAPDAVFRDRHRANDIVGAGDVDIVRFTWQDTRGPHAIGRALSPLLGPPRYRP